MALKRGPVREGRKGYCVYIPAWCAEDMVNHFRPHGRVLEPCKGDGQFTIVYRPVRCGARLTKAKTFSVGMNQSIASSPTRRTQSCDHLWFMPSRLPTTMLCC